MPSEGRSILLLGGSRHQVPAIEAAKRLGYRTVLCDYLPDNPGQFVADAFYQESTTDRELMLTIARREGVSGVLSFGSDVAAPTASYVAESLGLPANPLDSVEILSEKNLFRPYLAANGFNCPQAISIDEDVDADCLIRLAADMHYPVVLKPTDSSGSRGVSVMSDPDPLDFADALSYARQFSRNGTLILEEYIEYGFPNLIGGDIFVEDGEVRFWGLMSCLRDEKLAALVPVGKAYPIGLDDNRLDSVKHEVQRLVTSLGMRFGEMNVEVIVSTDNRPFILELGGRAGGNMIPLQLKDISGIDLVEASVLCAMGDGPVDVSFRGNDKVMATSVLHAKQSGIFRRVTYAQEFKDHIYREMIYVNPGDKVERLTYGSNAIGIVFLSFDSQDEMYDLLSRASELVTVEVS